MISANLGEQKIHIGDTIRVYSQVVEGLKSRVQAFEGILIRLRGAGVNKTFTVRKIGAAGVGIERTWPLDARDLIKIEVKKKTSGVRRSKLYYLRKLSGGKAVRV